MIMPEKVRLAIDLIKLLKSLPHDKPQRVQDLAPQLETTSKNYLHQVVAVLSKVGLVSVIRGPAGGITASLSEASVLDLYQAFGYMTEDSGGTLPSSQVERDLKAFLSEIVV